MSKASNKLFSRYAMAVSLILIMGIVTPSEASFSEANATQIDAGIDTAALGNTLMADNDGYLTKINPQTSSGDRSSMNDRATHTVASGETVSTIASSYGLKSATVLWENGISNANSIRVGQKLYIPPVDGVTHTVAKGEDIGKVAKEYGVKSEDIVKQNRLVATTLAPGQEIYIPGGKPLVVDTPVRASTPGRAGTRTEVASVGVGVGGAILPRSGSSASVGKIFIFPTRGNITQGFHAGHYAFDIADRSQPPIWAAGAGKVVTVVTGCAKVSYGCGGGYGNHVIIDHGNGIQTLYGHMEYVLVKQGDQVSQGDVIGKMGRSGNVRGATGIHLHFEVRKNGKKEVPSNYY
jgi:murein DD-endopeptidase MepM/ murein hydrolase activator NlpD